MILKELIALHEAAEINAVKKALGQAYQEGFKDGHNNAPRAK